MKINSKIGKTQSESLSVFLHSAIIATTPASLNRERVSVYIAVVATIPHWLILSSQKQNGVLNFAIKSRQKNPSTVCALDNLVGDVRLIKAEIPVHPRGIRQNSVL